jgi:hypothetical protein
LLLRLTSNGVPPQVEKNTNALTIIYVTPMITVLVLCPRGNHNNSN